MLLTLDFLVLWAKIQGLFAARHGKNSNGDIFKIKNCFNTSAHIFILYRFIVKLTINVTVFRT